MKQEIKEIAKVICPTYGKLELCKYCAFSFCVAEVFAEKLYNEGYRKQSAAVDAVEEKLSIVRCKDCKYPSQEGFCVKGVSGLGYKIIKPDDFCCFGEAIESEKTDVKPE